MLDSLNLEALQRIGLTMTMMQALQPQTCEPGQRLMRITELQRDAMTLHDGENERTARALPALTRELQSQDQMLAVGDWVLAEANAHGQWWVQSLIPPVSQITRRIRDNGDAVRRQVLVSNVDTALMLMGLDHDFNLRRLERYVALSRTAGIASVLVLTKADTCPLRLCAERLAQAREILPPQTMALALDARGAEARDALAPWLGVGQTLVLVGSSGAGKSTLTNTLMVNAVQDVGAARLDDGRGRHTTTARTMHLTAQGACIIDTPGLRALRLDVGDEADLVAAFGDIQQHAGQCRFRNCRHHNEPGCAVREAVAPERLDNFHKLQREARRDSMTFLERREQVQQWKSRGREGRQGLAAKRGQA